jgi:alcohol dehydrogenase YqhD (iron-dependent ADH family)
MDYRISAKYHLTIFSVIGVDNEKDAEQFIQDAIDKIDVFIQQCGLNASRARTSIQVEKLPGQDDEYDIDDE